MMQFFDSHGYIATALVSRPSSSHVQGPGARTSVVSWSRAGVPCWCRLLSDVSRCTLRSSSNDFRLIVVSRRLSLTT